MKFHDERFEVVNTTCLNTMSNHKNVFHPLQAGNYLSVMSIGLEVDWLMPVVSQYKPHPLKGRVDCIWARTCQQELCLIDR